MHRSLKLSQMLARAAIRLQPNQAWSASHVMNRKNIPVWSWLQGRWTSGEGEGRGGGSGGSIRSAGGSFGKKQVAEEDRYFREESARQIRDLKKGMTETLSAKLHHHQKELMVHQDCLQRHLEQLAKDGDGDQHQWHINHHEQSIKFEQAEIDKIKEMWNKLNLG